MTLNLTLDECVREWDTMKARRSEDGSLALGFFDERKGRRRLEIGNRETGDALVFVSNIPDGWEHGPRGRATMKVPNVLGEDGKPVRFEHQMAIWHPRCSVEFQVYFDTGFWYVYIYVDVSQLDKKGMSFMGIKLE